MTANRVRMPRSRSWLLAVLIAGLWVSAQPLRAAERSSKTAKAAAEKTDEAGKLDPQVEARLNDILAHQQEILQRLDQVMEELKIIKIRATVR